MWAVSEMLVSGMVEDTVSPACRLWNRPALTRQVLEKQYKPRPRSLFCPSLVSIGGIITKSIKKLYETSLAQALRFPDSTLGVNTFRKRLHVPSCVRATCRATQRQHPGQSARSPAQATHLNAYASIL